MLVGLITFYDASTDRHRGRVRIKENIMFNCPYCNEDFETKKECGLHKRLCICRPDYKEQIEKKKLGGKKSTHGKGIKRNKIIKYNVECEHCNKKFDISLTENEYNRRIHFYCSRKCANSRILTKEIKEKISNTLKNKNKKEFTIKLCKKCNKKLGKHNKSGYCKECIKHSKEYKEKLSKSLKNNKNVGGYRKGSGIGKCGWYKGYYCDSSWELAFVIYNIEHGIKFERNKNKFEYEYEGKKFKYLPDFIMDGKYIEIKGYSNEQWIAKLKQFPKNETLIVLYEKDMKKYIDYVKNKYGNNYIELYDGSKPIKNLNETKSAWFYLKNETEKLIIQEYVFNNNYHIYLNNGWKLGRYSRNIHKDYKLVKHSKIKCTTEIDKEKKLRNLINL